MGQLIFENSKNFHSRFVFWDLFLTKMGLLTMGYQNDPDGTRSSFSYVSEIGPKMWSQDGNCAHFGFCLGTKSPMMDPPNHGLMLLADRVKYSFFRDLFFRRY